MHSSHMIKIILLTAYSSLLAFKSFSQESLKGRVLDSLTKEPLPYANVRIIGKPIIVTTNTEGYFSLPFEREDKYSSLRISIIGFITKTIALKDIPNERPAVFLLQESTSQLEEVVITAPDAERIIQAVSDNLKKTFSKDAFEFEGYYRNSYKEDNTFVSKYETAFAGFDQSFHNRSGHSVIRLKQRKSRDYRKFSWKQMPGNLPWHYLWRIRRQHLYFFEGKNYKNYKYDISDTEYLEGEKIFKIEFTKKDAEQSTQSWVFVNANDYSILEIGGTTKIHTPEKFQLAEDLLMAYTESSILLKYVPYQGKMYPVFCTSEYVHEVYNEGSLRQASFVMNEELFIHEIIAPTIHKGKGKFNDFREKQILNLADDSTFWATYNKPVETKLSKKIDADLQWLAGSSKQHEVVKDIKNLLSAEELKADFELFLKSLHEAHPSLNRYSSEQEMERLFDDAFQRLNQPLAALEFYLLLTPIIAKIRCGHTGSLPPKSYFKGQQVAPFQVKYLGNKLFLFSTFSKTNPEFIGLEITSINGLSVADIISRIEPHLSIDGFVESAKSQEISRDFGRLYNLYVEQVSDFSIVLKKENQQSVVLKLEAITYQDFLDWTEEKVTKNNLHFIDSNTSLLKVESFMDSDGQPFKDWVDDSFRMISERNVSNLIIDLRDNEGGRDDYAMYLLSFLTDQPFRYHRSLYAASNYFSFLEHTNQSESLNTLMGEIVNKDSLGNYVLRSAHLTLQLQEANKGFSGKLFFVTNGNTFSAATDFAALSKELDLGIFVGEETGGTFEGNTSNGDITLTLPNSGIRVGIPLFRIENAVSRPMEKGRGVIPDYPITYSIQDFLKGRDNDLEFVREIIAGKE